MCDQEYGRFINKITMMDKSIFKSPIGSTLNAAQATHDANKRAVYWSRVQVELTEKLLELDQKMDAINNHVSSLVAEQRDHWICLLFDSVCAQI